ncbi:ArsR family transcriptional regulator [Bdellovibrionota bacterium FG-1]
MIISTLFGSETAEKALLYLENYGSGYPRGIAKAFDVAVGQVQKQLEKFELEGVLSSRLVGRTRVYEWNPRCFYLDELRGILAKSLKQLPSSIHDQYFRERTRPRDAAGITK